MRRRLLAAAAAGTLVLALSPAKADISDAVFEEGIDAIVESLLEAADLPAWVSQLLALLGIIGGAENSYLGPGGADLGVLYPTTPPLGSPEEGIEYGTLRYEDRQARVTEAMDLTSTVMQQLPFNAAELKILQAANLSPLSVVAALQIGNEVNIRTAEALNKQNSILAELGQLEADQRAKEDYDAYALNTWKQEHYGEGWLGAATSFAPESYRLSY